MKLTFILAHLALLASCLCAKAGANIVAPVLDAAHSYNLNDSGLSGSGPSDLTNSSNLSTTVYNADTLAHTLSIANATAGTYRGSWVTGSTGSRSDYFATKVSPTFVWDLSINVSIAHILLWQYPFSANGNQARVMELRFNQESQGASQFSGPATTLTLAFNTFNSTAPVQTFALGEPTGIVARYVQMTVTDNYFGIAASGGDRVGLNEVRFNVTNSDVQINSVPESSSLILVCLAPLYLLHRRGWGFARVDGTL